MYLFHTDIVVPAFSGQSFFSTNFPNVAILSISLSLRTTTHDALVVFVPGENDSYITLRVTESGNLALDYRVGTSGTITVTAPLYYVADAQWHSINIVAADSLSLSIDNRVSYSMPIPSRFNDSSVLYVGGFGDSSVPLEIQLIPGLVGCIDRLLINSQPFQNNFVNGVGIAECMMGACTSTACSDNGVCMEEPTAMQGYKCECNLQYIGADCNQGKPFYINSYCRLT